MSETIADLSTLLAHMEPHLSPGRYVFASLSAGQRLAPDDIVASVREPEGLSVVVSAAVAEREGLAGVFPCAWITLSVNSDLQAVGLTAAFAAALAQAGIGCNVVAGTWHDHIFVPWDQAQAAMAALLALQKNAPA